MVTGEPRVIVPSDGENGAQGTPPPDQRTTPERRRYRGVLDPAVYLRGAHTLAETVMVSVNGDQRTTTTTTVRDDHSWTGETPGTTTVIIVGNMECATDDDPPPCVYIMVIGREMDTETATASRCRQQQMVVAAPSRRPAPSSHDDTP